MKRELRRDVYKELLKLVQQGTLQYKSEKNKTKKKLAQQRAKRKRLEQVVQRMVSCLMCQRVIRRSLEGFCTCEFLLKSTAARVYLKQAVQGRRGFERLMTRQSAECWMR